METVTLSPDKLAASIKAEKPKRTKPRRISREWSVRFGKWEINVVIWKHKK